MSDAHDREIDRLKIRVKDLEDALTSIRHALSSGRRDQERPLPHARAADSRKASRTNRDAESVETLSLGERPLGENWEVLLHWGNWYRTGPARDHMNSHS